MHAFLAVSTLSWAELWWLQSIDKRFPASERGDLLVFLSGANEINALAEEVCCSYLPVLGKGVLLITVFRSLHLLII